MSFIEWTARSQRAVEQPGLDFLGEQPLAADLGQRSVLDPVALGAHDDDLDRSPSSRPGSAASSAALTMRAWASAKGEPRVPSRSGGGASWLVSRGSAKHRPSCLEMDVRDGDIVLGIETSCDETAVALVRADRTVLSAPLFSQLAEHAPYGGVVPEIAARAHVEKLDLLIDQAMRRGRHRLRRPRRGGGHRRSGPDRRPHGGPADRQDDRACPRPAAGGREPPRGARADRPVRGRRSTSPICCCWSPAAIASSSRSRALAATACSAPPSTIRSARRSTRSRRCWGSAIRAGRRRAAGAGGDPARFDLPRPLHGHQDLRLLLLRAQDRGAPPYSRSRPGCRRARHHGRPVRRVPGRGRRRAGRSLGPRDAPAAARATGSAARWSLPAAWRRTCICASGWSSRRRRQGFTLMAPPLALCTDNAIMVAWAGIERLRLGAVDDQAVAARARWPLEELAPPA